MANVRAVFNTRSQLSSFTHSIVISDTFTIHVRKAYKR